MRNLAADRHAGPRVEHRDHGIGDRAADVVEVDVDALGAQLAQLFDVVLGGAIVERAVEAQLVDDIASFFVVSRNAHGAATFDLGDLADDRADGPGRARDEDGLARLGRADVEQAEIGREARHAQHA